MREIGALTSEIELIPSPLTVSAIFIVAARLSTLFLVRSLTFTAEMVFKIRVMTIGTTGLITTKEMTYAEGMLAQQRAMPDSEITVSVGKLFIQRQTSAWNLGFLSRSKVFNNTIFHFLRRFRIELKIALY